MGEPWSVARKTVAKEVFGRPLRVALARWIAERKDPNFFQKEAQRAMDQLGLSDSGVPVELRLFVKHGLLTRYEDERRVFFSVCESPLWQALTAADKALDQLELAVAEPRAGATVAGADR